MDAVLVIDSDVAFLEGVAAEALPKHYPVVTVRTITEAHERLCDKTLPLSGIVVSAAFDWQGMFLVLREWVNNRYGIPIYIVYDSNECPIPPDQIAKLGIHGTFKKPISMRSIFESITELQQATQADSSTPGPEQKPDFSDLGMPEAGCKDADFHPIKAGIFMAGHRSDFDIYIRVGGNYIKVIRQGDSLERERLDKYIRRGVIDFYIRKEAQLAYLDYCSVVLNRILPHERVPFSVKAAQVFNYGEQTIQMVRSFGLNTESLAYCKDSVERIQNLIRVVDRVDSPAIRLFFSNAVAFEHGVATAVFAGLLGRVAPFYIDKKADIVLLTALLHDIGLTQLPPELQDEIEDKMSAKQKELYRTHPTIGGDILSGIRSIPEIVVQAVKQHHERRNGKGFPSQAVKAQPNLIAEVVGLGDEFLRYVKSDAGKGFTEGKRTNTVILAEVLKGFSPTVVDGFRQVFFAPSKNEEQPG